MSVARFCVASYARVARPLVATPWSTRQSETHENRLRMLYVYPKGKQDNLTPGQLAELKKVVERWSDG